MKINVIFQILIVLILLAAFESARKEHVHLKIHIPEIIHRHKHIKTKYIHVFHPKVIHTDHSAIQYLHSRNDPNGQSLPVNGGYPQPLINFNNQPELRITEEEFLKWRETQKKKLQEEQIKLEPDNDDQDKNTNFYNEGNDDDETRYAEEERNYQEELYKQHNANIADSTSNSKGSPKPRNHKYGQDYDASDSDKNFPLRTANKKKNTKKSSRPQQSSDNPSNLSRRPPEYGFLKQPEAEATNIKPQYHKVDPSVFDPSYYSTLPKDEKFIEASNQDDIYSGLIVARYDKKTADKSKILGDMNYSRKQHTKNGNKQLRNK